MSVSEPTQIRPDGTKVWKDNDGRYHRLDGPAIIHANGKGYFFWHGKQYPSLETFPKLPDYEKSLKCKRPGCPTCRFLFHYQGRDFFFHQGIGNNALIYSTSLNETTQIVADLTSNTSRWYGPIADEGFIKILMHEGVINEKNRLIEGIHGEDPPPDDENIPF